MKCHSRGTRRIWLIAWLCIVHWGLPSKAGPWAQEPEAAAKVTAPYSIRMHRGESDSAGIRIDAGSLSLTNIRVQAAARSGISGAAAEGLVLELSSSEISDIPARESRYIDLTIRAAGTGFRFDKYTVDVVIQTDQGELRDSFNVTVMPTGSFLSALAWGVIALLIAVFLIIFIRMTAL